MLMIGLALLAVAVGVGFFTVVSTAEERSTVRASLRQLEGYEVDNVRDQELLKPMSDRTVKPFMDRASELGRRFTPDGYTDKIRAKFLTDGEAFAKAVKAAREWEAANRTKFDSVGSATAAAR